MGTRAAPVLPPGHGVRMVLLRNLLNVRAAWPVYLTGFFEPVFYLFSIGVGVGQLVDGFRVDGHPLSYAAFVAPGMLAVSAFNGALMDSTFNVFFKLKHARVYDQMLATPLTSRDVAIGEIGWGLLRGGVYSAVFLLVMAVMGHVQSWWGLLALPAAMLIAFAFSAVCMALTTWMRSFQDFDKVTLAQMPLFLFSGTFFPLEALDRWASVLIECTPLYRGVVLCRELCTGHLTWQSPLSVVYLVVLGMAGLWVVRRRLDTLLLT